MACGEAATNAIEHAGERARCPSWSPGDCGTGGWRSRSATRGPGARRARGITGAGSLIETLMDSVDVVPSDEGTTVRMTRRLDGNGGLE